MTLMKDLNCLNDEISQLKNDRHVVEQDAELKQLVLDLKEEFHQLKKHVTSAEDLAVPSQKQDISNATSAASFAKVLTKAVDSRAPVGATRKSCSTGISAGSSKAHISKRKEGGMTTAKHKIQGYTTSKLPIVEEEHIQSDYEWRVNESPKRQRRKLSRVGTLPSTNLKAVSRPVHIYGAQFDPNTTETQMAEFINNQFKSATSVDAVKLKTRYDSYASFKISVTGVLFNGCFSLENWFVGILVKKFYNPPSQRSTETLNQKHAEQA